MKINIFGYKLLGRFILFCILGLTFFWCIFQTNYLFTTFIFGLLFAISLFEIYKFLNKTNRDLHQFLFKLNHRDFQSKLPLKNDSINFNKLSKLYNGLLSDFEQESLNLKEKNIILASAADSFESGLLVCNSDGEILLMNKSICEDLNLSKTETMEGLQSKSSWPCFTSYKSSTTKWKITPENQNYTIDKDYFIEVIKKRIRSQEIYIFMGSSSDSLNLNEQHWLNYIKVISHEIGNGISPIRSVAETLKNDLNNGDVNIERLQKGLDLILQESDGLIEFSNRYRQFIQVPDIVKETINISEFIHSIAQNFDTKLKLLNITLILNFDNSIHIQGDVQLLKQVFINLFLNSFEALQSTKNPEIKITLEAKGHQILLHFEDNGCGISKEKISQVFIPFYTTKPNGSGIGLSLVQQILWKHQARIFLKSEPEIGSIFTLVFKR